MASFIRLLLGNKATTPVPRNCTDCSYEVGVRMPGGELITSVQDIGHALNLGQRVRVIQTRDAQAAIFTL
ncbi:MAG: hypothetical protein IAE98_10460 [Candidatus Kapabacteria bacterium]|nr:hypothetical protein [Candidatus Kapabacteria bacterium]